MTATITHDILRNTSCELVPGQAAPGPGWFLIAANNRVEAGPFPEHDDACRAARWLEENARGVHPGPWVPSWHPAGLLIGSRLKQWAGVNGKAPTRRGLTRPL